MYRDHNTTIIIRQKGIMTLPAGCGKVTPPERLSLAVSCRPSQAISLNEEAN
ncbi:MAG: hypothetical protein OXC46_04190 [Thaumarchaeota archaeon]|nr:hypothetical protein [Nitrososphaerota archaeon]